MQPNRLLTSIDIQFLYSLHALWRVHLNDVVLRGFEGSYHGGSTSFALSLDIASAIFIAGDDVAAVDAMP